MGRSIKDEYGDANGNTIYSDNSNRDAAELAVDQYLKAYGSTLESKKKNNLSNINKKKKNINKKRRQLKNKSRYFSSKRRNSKSSDRSTRQRATSA